MAAYPIPLSGVPETFTIQLAGVPYRLTVAFHGPAGWLLDIADESGTAMVCGIPLVTGTDLLGQYAYLGIGGGLYVQTDGDPDAPPTFSGLGTTSRLYFVTPE